MKKISIQLVLLYLIVIAVKIATAGSTAEDGMANSACASNKLVEDDPFFPPDRTLVTWAHAVNSQTLLNDSFADTSIMMLEADITLEFLIGSAELIPIMAHPPTIFSDLSFEMFLRQVLDFNGQEVEQRKGIKLDVKQLVAVEPVLKILQENSASDFDFPIWFNADILLGPINSTGIPVNGEKFLNLTSVYLPEATLSLGWTTRYSESVNDGKYSMENANEMLNLLRAQNLNPKTSITYPVRAGLAAQSIEEMLYLVNTSELTWSNSSLTLWSSADDPVDLYSLKQLIELVGRQRCFTDLPFTIPE